jgi:glutaminyl-tRNA synthetase
VDVTLFEHAVREHLNATAPRAMAVLDPLKVVVENFPADGVEWLDAPWHPEDASHGSRKVPLTRELWVERDDYRDDPPKKWFRLAPGREVRLRYACLLRCHDVVRDAAGNPVELRCTWDPESRGGRSPDGRRVDGTLHWVSAAHAVDAEVRLYDRLFRVESPGDDFLAEMNPESLRVVHGAKLEPALAGAPAEHRVQFERVGYFVADRDGTSERPVWNRTISLRDTWARIERRGG